MTADSSVTLSRVSLDDSANDHIEITFTATVEEVAQPVIVPKSEKTVTMDRITNGMSYTFMVKRLMIWGLNQKKFPNS